ncbi:hypothetical protein JOJ87_004984 [Rhodococcus ruber]|uniref:DUF3263 domain-containing protein n=1 Tax=Rhodococcus ruber TaxID=1830 RepID=UPI001DA5132B|nr:hypothetical protein [Rhodococcus ruber]
MRPDDRAMLAFAAKWSPFGGGDEHILPEFGLTPAVFYRRLLAMVTTTPTDEVDFATRTFLRQFCVSKLSRSTRCQGTGGRPCGRTGDLPACGQLISLSAVR